MATEINEVLNLCMKVKEKGHDCFFSYRSHVDWIEVTIHVGGWSNITDTQVYLIRLDGVVDEEYGYYSISTVKKALIELLKRV